MNSAVRAPIDDASRFAASAPNDLDSNDPEFDGSPEVDPGEVLRARTARPSIAVLVALGLALVAITVMAPGIGMDGATEGAPRLGGDFPAFYAAGSIVAEGDIDQLYDPERQALAQDALGLDGYLAFAYPPHVAVAYAPFGMIDYRVAYLVHSLLMAAAFVVAVVLLGRVVPVIERWRWQVLAAGFTFVPLIAAVGGGQNASLSVLAFAVVWYGLAERREVLAGVAAGALAFRPQYALPLIGVLFLARHWRAVAAALGTVAAVWVATAVLVGRNWVNDWADAVVPFVERDAEVNAANSISVLGVLHAWFGTEAPVANVVGVGLAVAAALTVSAMWVGSGRFSLADRMGAVSLAVLVISPHAMFYDAALVTIAGAALLARGHNRPGHALMLVWLAALSHSLNDRLGWTPLALVVLGAFAMFVFTSSGAQQKAVSHA